MVATAAIAKPVPVAPPAADWREILRAEVAELADLPFNWDCEDGHAPAREEVDNALSFIDHIPEAGLRDAVRSANGEGEIGFAWQTPQCSISISFSDGEISFAGELPNGGELLGCEKYNKNAIPADLQRLLDANFPPTKGKITGGVLSS